MISVIFTIIFILAAGASGYATYYFFEIKNNQILTYVCLSLFVAFLVVAFILAVNASVNRLKRDRRNLIHKLEKWRDISYHVNEAGDNVFNKLPIGILIYEFDHTCHITWVNKHTSVIFNGIHLPDLPVEDASVELYDNIINNKDSFIVNINSKAYDVVHDAQNKTIYLFEVTERETIKKRYNERITAVGVIEIDNLDESLKKFDLQEKATIRGKILSEISEYFTKYHCHLESAFDDKMVIVMDKKSLLDMRAEDFSFLKRIREIASENKLKSSVSMGIACYDNDYDELGAIAQNALELAIKRGGDQIVINVEGEKIQYVGGNTNSVEKNTLVEARMQTTSLKEAVEGSDKVFVMCHNFADCDAIGSMIGAYYMAKSSIADVKMVFNPEKADVTVKKIFNELKETPIYSDFITLDVALEAITPTSLLIVTDTQSPKLVMFKELLEKAQRLSVIDHHRAGDDGYSNYLTYYVETSASSTVELVSEMLPFYDAKIKLSNLEASIMLAGIVVDTNNFTMRAGARTFEAAATLREMGADMIYVRKILQEPLTSERIIAEAVSKATVYGEIFGIVCLDEEMTIPDRTTLAKISDKLLTIEGVDASFTIGRINSELVGISARSLGNAINVQLIMEQMGGGGHFNSAASQVKGSTILEVKDKLEELLRIQYVEGGTGEMKVILTQDVKGKGKKNDIIDVANGYANYLINNKLALPANQENIDKVEQEIETDRIATERKRAVLKKFAEDIEGRLITIQLKVGANGKTFGSITSKQVSEELHTQTGILIDKKKIELPGDINSIGIFTAVVKLDVDIVAHFEIKVEEKK